MHAHITVLPKPGKDPSLCGSYKPISLLNIDAKLYAKVLEPDYYLCFHNGFIPGREAKENASHTISLISHARKSSQSTFLLSNNAEKAFDRVNWEFLMSTLSYLGIGTKMMSMIAALYDTLTAQLRINGTLSDPFTLHNGIRQGCPLNSLPSPSNLC